MKLMTFLLSWLYCHQVNMSPRLKILNNVIEKLKTFENKSTGQLYGIFYDKSIFILGFCILPQKNENEEEKSRLEKIDTISNFNLIPHLPANITMCGVFNVSPGGSVDNIANDILENDKGVSVVINIDPSSKEVTTHSCEDGSVKKTDHTFIDENSLSKLFVHIRLTASVMLSCDFQHEYVQESFELIHQKIKAGNAAFQMEGSSIYLLGDETDSINGISPDSTVEQLLSNVNKNNESKSGNGLNLINVIMYLKGTNNDKVPQVAPVIKYVKKVYKHAGIQLALDTLAMVPSNLKIKHLYPIIVESVDRSVTLNEQSLLSQLKSADIRNVSLPQTYHFLPQCCGHFVSIAYPSKQNIDQLKKTRETFHTLLGLPMDKPLLRPGNAFDFSNTVKNIDTKILYNVHEGLGISGVPDGEPYFVQGIYAYHHYMQDNMDDNGWGCAYRSLQTIFSWFRLQGYTNMPVPSHKDIQQCLVDIGDKPASFVGSKQWIGSTEVGFLLDTMLGVTCRIVNVSSGEEMTMKGGELSHHFRTQGTPIMIGGGVLAHTIIGVDYNKKTGAIKYLILDPHYTGGEDLKVIQSKGWCGWKGPEFWKKDAFYNMCMPLKPKCV